MITLRACAFVCLFFCGLAHADTADGSGAYAHPMRTTHADIATRNLEFVIERTRRALAADPLNVSAHQHLLDHLLLRFHFGGEIDDLDEAEQLSRSLAKNASESQRALLLRSTVLQVQHRYAEACSVLSGVDSALLKEEARRQRESIAVASGHADRMVATLRQRAEAQPNYQNFTRLASALGELDRTADADRAYAAALDSYTDVSPFAVAWVQFQRGNLWRDHQPDRAAQYYEAALARMPRYVAASVHLAEVEMALGKHARAIQRLNAVLPTTSDPDVPAVLASFLDEPGQQSEVIALREQAYNRFKPWVDKHPHAIRKHAMEFFNAVSDQSAIDALPQPEAQQPPEACIAI